MIGLAAMLLTAASGSSVADAIVPAALLLAAGALYAAGARRLGRRWPAMRSAAFGAGLLAVAVALGPLDGPADRLLSAHMVQHMLILVVAAPLLVIGSPLALALRALHGPWRRALRSLLAVPVLAHPLTGWIALTAVVLGTHLTRLYELALTHPAVHALEHMLYLGAGILFWRPVAGLDPVPHRPALTGRLLLLLTAMAPMGLIGVAMLDAAKPWYSHYASRPGALADQHLAAVVMWVGGGMALGAASVAVGWSAALREHRRQLRLEEAALR